MANALIAFYNRIDAASVSGGSWLASLPLTNIQDPIIGRVARSADLNTNSTQFDADIGADRLVRVVALVGHNLSLTAEYRVRGATDSGFTTVVVDSGWQEVWPPVYASTSLNWQAPNWWGGRYLPDEIEGFTWTKIFVADTSYNVRYWRVEMSDPDNAEGYVQVGRVFIGDAWQPELNILYGYGLRWETKTQIREALSGSEYFDRRTPYRVVGFTTEAMDVDEAFGNAFEIQRRAGLDGEVVFMLDPDDTLHALRRQYLGRLRELSPIENPYPDLHRTAWEIKERI